MPINNVIYETGCLRETNFADIRLISNSWPVNLFLNPTNDINWVCNKVTNRETYEEVDRKSVEENTARKLMVVLRHDAGLWLVDGYGCYAHCKSLVKSGRLPSAWKMYNLKCDGKAIRFKALVTALHVGLKKVDAEGKHVSLGPLLRAVSQFQTPNERAEFGYDRVAQEVKFVFHNTRWNIPGSLISNMVNTAMRLSHNPLVLDYIEDNHFCLISEITPGNIMFREMWSNSFFLALYKQDWWFFESEAVQLMLVILVLYFHAFFGVLLDQRDSLRRQVITILRQCAKLIEMGHPGKVALLLRRETKSRKPLPRGQTVLRIIVDRISDRIFNVLTPFIIHEVGEDTPDNNDYILEEQLFQRPHLSRDAVIPQAVFNNTSELCVTEVTRCLQEFGYITSRHMMRDAEEKN